MGAGEWHGAGIAVQSPVFGVRCRSSWERIAARGRRRLFPTRAVRVQAPLDVALPP